MEVPWLQQSCSVGLDLLLHWCALERVAQWRDAEAMGKGADFAIGSSIWNLKIWVKSIDLTTSL